MYTIPPKKMVIINILDILKKYSDMDHRLTQAQIIEILKKEYYMDVDRRTVKRNLMNLLDFDFGYYSFYLGTVTAIDSNGNFIGLSHNLKDEQMPFDFLDNAIYKTSYIQAKKNTLFNTGYLVTSADGDKIGKFTGTGDGGICGNFENYTYNPNLALEIGTPKVGTAYLYCKSPVTNELKMHEIEIAQVGKYVSQIKVVDKDLLKYRGGIVQGMSGTPVIQDNKIVGGARAVVKSNKRIGVMTNIDYMIKNCNK